MCKGERAIARQTIEDMIALASVSSPRRGGRFWACCCHGTMIHRPAVLNWCRGGEVRHMLRPQLYLGLKIRKYNVPYLEWPAVLEQAHTLLGRFGRSKPTPCSAVSDGPHSESSVRGGAPFCETTSPRSRDPL